MSKPKNYCPECRLLVTTNSVQCVTECGRWYHAGVNKCAQIRLKDHSGEWLCMDCLAKTIPVTPKSQASQPPQKPSAKRPVRGSGIGTSLPQITTGPKTNSELLKGTKPSAVSVDIPNYESEIIRLSEKIKTPGSKFIGMSSRKSRNPDKALNVSVRNGGKKQSN